MEGRNEWRRRLAACARWPAPSTSLARGLERQVPLPGSREPSAAPFVSNRVQTARYNLVNFLPKQLWAQFSKVANVYFLLIGCLQQIPGLSPTGQFTTIGPLAIFVTLAMVREAFDDLQRHRQDRVENNAQTRVWRGGAWRHVRWCDVVVGDVVQVTDGQAFPADIVVLHTSLDSGACYVETSSLDGESNLKERRALPLTQQNLSTADALFAAAGFIQAEAPSASLYTFDGFLSMNGLEIPLTVQQLLLRGSRLVNTREIIGSRAESRSRTRLI